MELTRTCLANILASAVFALLATHAPGQLTIYIHHQCLFGDEITAGGLGTILTQMDKDGNFNVIAYASQKLQKHEKNYKPFLLEMQASIFGM